MVRIHTIGDYQGYHVDAPQNVKERYCPGMRSCWSFRFASYNPFNRPTSADTIRRVCMIVTLGSRTILDVLGLWNNLVGMKVLGVLISLILGLIAFFFVAFCLAIIGDAEGERMVMRWNVGRWHLDAFLLFCALVHSSLLISRFSGLWTGFLGLGFGTAWIILWIFIVAVAWISTWDTISVTMA